MTTGASGATCPELAPTALPPWEAYDFEYFAYRLVDCCLLDGAVAIRIFRVPLLAVPAGSSRRGGALRVADGCIAVEIFRLLERRAGFPSLRIRLPGISRSAWSVEWGAVEPAGLDEAERARFYGLRSVSSPSLTVGPALSPTALLKDSRFP